MSVPLYPDHRIIPAHVSPEARDRIAEIDEEFAQMRERLCPLLDRYSELSVERETICAYEIPEIGPEEVDVAVVRGMEMLRADPDAYLAPAVRALLAALDAVGYQSISRHSVWLAEIEADAQKWRESQGIKGPWDEPQIFRPLPADYADPRLAR